MAFKGPSAHWALKDSQQWRKEDVKMIWLRSCPRCQGDLGLVRNEMNEVEASCIQCGYRSFGRASSFVPATGPGLIPHLTHRPQHGL